ncbi:MAG: winged helix-turn-helix domain-containing protein [Candidatus Bathyarchaeia archaeon]
MGEVYHPNAYLSRVRNVKSGLASRTKILSLLEESPKTAKGIGPDAQISYSTTLHHLHLLENERIVERTTAKPPYVWETTGIGQLRLPLERE